LSHPRPLQQIHQNLKSRFDSNLCSGKLICGEHKLLYARRFLTVAWTVRPRSRRWWTSHEPMKPLSPVKQQMTPSPMAPPPQDAAASISPASRVSD
jgi:hypothetical protein